MYSHIIGIDIAKYKFDITIRDNSNSKYSKCKTYSNNQEGVLKLLSDIKQSGINESKCLFICESTAHYHKKLCNILSLYDLPINEMNPIITGKMHAASIRQTKNDAIDSRLICDIAFLNRMDANYKQIAHIDNIKLASRHRFDLVNKRSRTKVQLQASLDYLLPKYNSLFSNKYNATYMYLLTEYSLIDLRSFRIDKLTRIVKDVSKGHHGKPFALKLQTMLRSDLLLEESELQCLELQNLAMEINFFTERIEILERKISILLNTIDTNLLSIPGVNEISLAMLIAEIGDFNNFSSPKKLVAFAGLDPRVYASGEYELKSAHISKHGNRYLRYSMFNIANMARLHCPEIQELYKKHIANGKHHLVAVNAIARKLLHVMWGMQKKQYPI